MLVPDRLPLRHVIRRYDEAKISVTLSGLRDAESAGSSWTKGRWLVCRKRMKETVTGMPCRRAASRAI
jgi:hypothetical protein